MDSGSANRPSPILKARSDSPAPGFWLDDNPDDCFNEAMKLLLEHHKNVADKREVLRLHLLDELRLLSKKHLKGCRLWVYGSLVEQGRFRPESDIDLALDHEPEHMTVYGVSAWLEESLGRKVDVTLLSETRLRETILKKGLTWIA